MKHQVPTVSLSLQVQHFTTEQHEQRPFYRHMDTGFDSDAGQNHF